MTNDELQNAQLFRAQREALVRDHLNATSGYETREAERQRQVQAAQAASRARYASYQEAQAQAAVARAERQAEREAQRAQVQANRAAPVEVSSIPRIADVHPPHVSRNVDREAQIAAFGHPVSDFVLRKLPRNDPKAIAYREAMMNPPVKEVQS